MSGGYGLHISLAEMIPNALRHGLANTVKTLYDRTIANLGYKADAGELDGLSRWLWDMGGEKAFNNSEDAQRLTAAYILMEGHKATPGLAAGENLQGEIDPAEKAAQGFRTGVPVGYRQGDRFGLFGNEHSRFPKLWQAALREAANDGWTRTGAAGLRLLRPWPMGWTRPQPPRRRAGAVVAHLQTESPEELGNFVRGSRCPCAARPRPGPRQTATPKPSWRTSRTSSTAAASQKAKAGSAVHMDFLNSLANGQRHALQLGGHQGHRPVRATPVRQGTRSRPGRHGNGAADRQLWVPQDPQPDGQHAVAATRSSPSESSRLLAQRWTRKSKRASCPRTRPRRRPWPRPRPTRCASSTTSTTAPSGQPLCATGHRSTSRRSRHTGGWDGCSQKTLWVPSVATS